MQENNHGTWSYQELLHPQSPRGRWLAHKSARYNGHKESIHSAGRYLYHPRYRFEILWDIRTSIPPSQHSSQHLSAHPSNSNPPLVSLHPPTRAIQHPSPTSSKVARGRTPGDPLANSCRTHLLTHRIGHLDNDARHTLHPWGLLLTQFHRIASGGHSANEHRRASPN